MDRLLYASDFTERKRWTWNQFIIFLWCLNRSFSVIRKGERQFHDLQKKNLVKGLQMFAENNWNILTVDRTKEGTKVQRFERCHFSSCRSSYFCRKCELTIFKTTSDQRIHFNSLTQLEVFSFSEETAESSSAITLIENELCIESGA